GEEDFPLSLSWIERCLVAGRALWFYAGKLVWPARLALIYPRWQMDAAVWWQYLFPLAALGAVAALWLWRGKIGKGPLVAILFFAGSLLPTLGFVSFYNMRHTFVADHFVYLACVGLVVLAAAVMCRALARWNVQPAWRASAAAALLIILGITTFQQGLLFVNPENLWTETLEENPGSWLAHYHLATTLETKGEYHQAADHLRDALRIKPDYSFAHFKLGNLLAREGKIEEAKEHLREVIRLAPEGDHNARGILGTLLARQGRLDEAADCLTAELEFHPDAALMHYNLALVRAQQKKWAEACNSLRQACAFASEVSKYHYALADVLRHLGRFDEASEEVNRAQRLERRGR
ncbi:MAG TPA: tetratricopeptide repeat protein, partial [Gemmataceae bacterium]|nr:tetratricopeptide repeat protein [Gemmataceae bacterium]